MKSDDRGLVCAGPRRRPAHWQLNTPPPVGAAGAAGTAHPVARCRDESADELEPTTRANRTGGLRGRGDPPRGGRTPASASVGDLPLQNVTKRYNVNMPSIIREPRKPLTPRELRKRRAAARVAFGARLQGTPGNRMRPDAIGCDHARVCAKRTHRVAVCPPSRDMSPYRAAPTRARECAKRSQTWASAAGWAIRRTRTLGPADIGRPVGLLVFRAGCSAAGPGVVGAWPAGRS